MPATSVMVLVFEVDGRRFGIPATATREVVRAATLSPLPAAPTVVDGALNLRGQMVPVIAVRNLLGLADKPLEHSDHFIIVQLAESFVALRVDLAVDLLRLDVEELDASKHAYTTDVPSAAISMSADGVIFVLDVAALLKHDTGQITQAMSEDPRTEAAR